MSYLALKVPGPNDTEKTLELPAPSGLPEVLAGSDKDAIFQISQTGYNLFFYSIIFIATAVIILSGIQIITSGGDSEKIKSAKARLFYAVIGLVVLLGAFFILGTLTTSILEVKPQNVR